MIPAFLLRKIADDPSIPENVRNAFRSTLLVDERIRARRGRFRTEQKKAGAVQLEFDCAHTEILPGTLISDPDTTSDSAAIACHRTTHDLIRFYREVFGRDGIDGVGGTIRSSIHYGVSYNNAAWDSNCMIYGDGDGVFFLNFTRSSDFIGHELTHGVTENSGGLEYANEPGAINESISDVFGSVFKQWQLRQSVDQADWMIGSDIMGPIPLARGWLCVRDLADPQSQRSATWQPKHYSDYVPSGDVHVNSGIGNFAFYTAAMELGGLSWEQMGRVWYRALTRCEPDTNYAGFAALCLAAADEEYLLNPAVKEACLAGWSVVGVL